MEESAVPSRLAQTNGSGEQTSFSMVKAVVH